MVYEAREGIICDANGPGTCNSDGNPTSTPSKKGFFRPLRKLSDAFKRSPTTKTPELGRGDFKNGFDNNWVSVPGERWTRRRSNSNSKLEKSRSLSDITFSFASAKPPDDYKVKDKAPATEVSRRYSVPSKPVVLDAKAHVKKPNKGHESKQQQKQQGRCTMRSSETSHKPARKKGGSVPNFQYRPRTLGKLSHELSSTQILPNKTMHIKGFPPQAPKTKKTMERISSNVKISHHGVKTLEAPAQTRREVPRPRAQSLSLPYPQKLNINFLDEEDTSQAEVLRPHSRSLPNTSSVFFLSGGSQNELEFVELNRKLDHATLQASASVLNEDGMTMLHKAAQNGFTVLTKFLVNNGVSTETVDSQGWSPLCVALNNDNFECAEVLVRLGANVNFVGHEGRTILHKMASEGNYKAVEFLINCQVGLDIEDDRGWPALHYAFRRKKLKCAALLMSSGADIARYTAKRVQEYSMATEIINISRCRHDLKADHEC